ncbi:MAG: PAS domain S-box protein, partial [Deltaproteobacteria bacterium]|nr:PAS domain S-box protein [Deltaproteobacteria bacterium]
MDFAPSSAPADQATPACADGRPEQSPVFVHAPNPMILVSPEAVILDINLAGHDLSGKPEMSLIGKRFGEAFDCVNASGNRVCGSSTGCQACPVRQTIAEVLLSGRPVHDLETKVTLIREGTPRRHDVLLSAVPMNQEGHNIVLICLVDITALKRAEQALRAGEEAYRLLVEHQTDLVVKVDSKGRFLFVSPSYCRTFGKTEAELLGREFMPLVHEEDRESTTRGMEALSRPPHTAYVEQRAKTAHGWRWLAWSDTAILNDWGEIEAVIGVGRDITAWKRTEESLRESEERFALAFKSSPAAQVVSDIETGRFIDVNDRWVELLGYSRQEQLGRTSKEVGIWADPTDRDRAVAGLKTKGSFKDRPIEFKTKSGLILSVLWSAETIALGGRQVMLSMIYDDTERKRAEQALRESEERYRLLSDVTMEGIVVHKNGVVVDLNVALARMTGYSREELLGQDILKRSVHEADRDIVRENMVKEYARPYVVRCLRKNGDIFHAELEGRDLQMDGQIFRAAAVRDVTARVMAERALRESEDRFANVMAAINDGIWDWDTQ